MIWRQTDYFVFQHTACNYAGEIMQTVSAVVGSSTCLDCVFQDTNRLLKQIDRQSSLGCWNNGLTTDSGYQQTVSDYDMLSFVRHADNCANNTVRWPRHDIGTAPHPYFPRRRPTTATNWRSIVFSPTTSNQSLFSRVPSRLPSSIHHSRHP